MITESKMAYVVARLAHYGQFRRDGVTPYSTHPVAVAGMVGEKAKPAAYLHDVLEDTFVTTEMLSDFGFSSETVAAVILLTKTPGEDYFGYINRVKSNPIAREVKIADITHNLNSNPKPGAVEKYRKALELLMRD